ncbi:DUF1697 domain-containing protein [Listeria booriae]|uniref:DUF1697 domain-containing protein n=1 Tax=Listeria booriae TaxID=1552123 RepID=UPI001624D23E|nr:DUF1697 domain-containing protein [Listeria booriae]MBC1906853.1 DUF1697 domain-containing protein [Listeria booriae]MBC2068437.1 DUF1697 domain-containing protein [Listeria booriae]
MKYIIFLRAINVGGNRKIKMLDLREVLTANAYQNVTTYIQSGNVIAEHAETSYEWVQEDIAALIEDAFGFDVPAIVFPLDEYAQGILQKPFEDEKLMVHFLNQVPEVVDLDTLKELGKDQQDRCEITGRFLYVTLSAGISDSIYSNKLVERVLHVKATARNWRTVTTMQEKSK